jgi:antitoxin component of MazEF toxin-antitoxin module
MASIGTSGGDKVEVTLGGGKIVIFPVTQKSPTEVLWNLSKNPTPTDQPDGVIAEANHRQSGESVEPQMRFVDSNIFIYVLDRHSRFGETAKNYSREFSFRSDTKHQEAV